MLSFYFICCSIESAKNDSLIIIPFPNTFQIANCNMHYGLGNAFRLNDCGQI